MENLPETLYVDPTGASPTTTTANGPESAAVERAKIEQCIQLLHQPSGREEALAMLNKERRCKDMPVLLWNSKSIPFILLQEICTAYKLLSPPAIGMKEATRVCNAIALFQSMASHPDTKMAIVKAKIPVYIYPFMNTTEQRHKHLTTAPYQLRRYRRPREAFVVSKILMYDEGQRYCGSFPERFYAVVRVLTKIVDQFHGKPSLQLLKHILTCFMRLSEVSRPCDALNKCYPARLRDPAYLNFVCEDLTVRRFADQVLHHVTTHSHRLG
ncbi:hypothetical protein OSB04_015917 [Centaurea solstitialis]|uniref:Cell differentiation protein rcd1 n=1 Tax=Centaurea solstitialis TaxID=347529 RepID=A0AA38W7Z0_9ASTR|nr:hypothetical protein OSB04_015917 [Centaurea solstitialis]